MQAVVTTTGFANKAVTWNITQDPETDASKKATVDLSGKVHIPVGHASSKTNKIEVTATSVYDNTKTGTASITVL